MKRTTFLLVFAVLAAWVLNAAAQDVKVIREDQGDVKKMIRIKADDPLKLTAEQKKLFKEMRLKHQKEVLPIQNELRVKELDLKTEMTADRPNMRKIEGIIDDIAKLKANVQKKRIAHRFEMRDQLTEEQKEIWNDMRLDDERPMLERGRRMLRNAPRGDAMMFRGRMLRDVPDDDVMLWRERRPGRDDVRIERRIEIQEKP